MLLKRLIFCLLASFAIACSEGRANGVGETVNDSGESASWPPSECDGLDSPFLGEACLEQLKAVCRSHENKDACVGQGRAGIGDVEGLDEKAYYVYCGWVPVVTFADATTCSVESAAWRCEAHIELSLLPRREEEGRG